MNRLPLAALLCAAAPLAACTAGYDARPPDDLDTRPRKPPAIGGRYEVEEFRNIPYVQGSDDERHELDVFIPRGRRNVPVLFFIHGGGFLVGSKDTVMSGAYCDFGPYLASRGIGVVAANYRLFPTTYPDNFADVARAIKWTKTNIAAFGGRPDRIFVGGHSAGGHMAALLGTDESHLKRQGLRFRDIAGFVPMSAPYDLEADHMPGSSLILGALFGGGGNLKRASPINHVRKGLRPFLIVYAENELFAIGDQAPEFYRRMRAVNKSDTSIYRAADRTHVTMLSYAVTDDDPLVRRVLRFVAQYSAKPGPPQRRKRAPLPHGLADTRPER